MKYLSYIVSSVYLLFFGLSLVISHGIQWICLKLGGQKWHNWSVNLMQFTLMRCQNLLGTRYTLKNPHELNSNQPIIIVSNHQSMNDISPMIWLFKKHFPKFISKKELGKGIPGISFNLRHGGAALIDRNDPKQAITEIIRFAKYIHENNYSAVIFPEGTRSKNGVPRPFKRKGLDVLFKYIPNAQIVPVTINNSWKTTKYGKFPYGLGAHITVEAHKPLLLSDFPKDKRDELLEHIEKVITEHIVID
ncbi:1-acyl-sn-glycerol-3-phosphate acyltransferase [Kordia antarctica]|uniref:1-acyl-sn-glycerol-3-phosphate acyltransferase n=1 Tax=Kordia antarctica TaxID=1218801 RepID=A0A7L4ZM96_9FLAO|nr:lysophospholipid acyltransferase family protein [Kordia antarctica]QHI37316.1 1-acyl-sn-glycerol-3-phosphate acyltransferase [Kordia antarctica]